MGQVVPIHYIPGDIFTWVDGVGVVEDSTLTANDYHHFTSHMVVKSHKTGQYKTFFYTDDIYNEDGDIDAFIFMSEDGIEIHVLND